MLQSIHKLARIACLAAALLCAGAAPSGLAADGEETIVLRAARLFDGTSERLRSDAVVVVRGGRIVGVGSKAAIPPAARTIDLGDATLLPGFIDVHSHLTLEPDANYYRKSLNELMRAIHGILVFSHQMSLNSCPYILRPL